MQASQGFLMLAQNLIKDIHKNRTKHNSALGIIGQSFFDTYGPGWISLHWEIKSSIWVSTCNMTGVSRVTAGPENWADVENFLTTYLLVLGEVCNIDVDTILQTEDLKNANPEASSI